LIPRKPGNDVTLYTSAYPDDFFNIGCYPLKIGLRLTAVVVETNAGSFFLGLIQWGILSGGGYGRSRSEKTWYFVSPRVELSPKGALREVVAGCATTSLEGKVGLLGAGLHR
jgi:hypothetical protein